MLQCVALCCSVLQCVAADVCESHPVHAPVTLLSVTPHVIATTGVLQCVAVCCSVLQCVAVCCSMLQYAAQRVAVCCSVLQRDVVSTPLSVTFRILAARSALQCVAMLCSVLQLVEMCCSIAKHCIIRPHNASHVEKF